MLLFDCARPAYFIYIHSTLGPMRGDTELDSLVSRLHAILELLMQLISFGPAPIDHSLTPYFVNLIVCPTLQSVEEYE